MHNTNTRLFGLFTVLMITPLVFAAPGNGDGIKSATIPDYDIDKLNISTPISSEPTVYPGPGLPSLESLGLTSSNLFNDSFMKTYLADKATNTATTQPPLLASKAYTPQGLHSLEKRFTNRCLNDTNGVGYGTQAGLTACYNYLSSLGTTECAANSNGIVMCYATVNGFTSYVTGQPINTTTYAASYCRDVATGMAWGILACVWCPKGWSDCVAESLSAAYGNGNLIIRNWGNAFP
ncbi:uncharacterized protein TRIVIDRAFT_91410 [Trichoderma virens Gv29-8]|uniref:Cyanovirin-N domain-containing protein n=1 Tax=Hypocrea virens (strain Gv29-8 / FGSC 10586) TaxID=413071 RepID=G9MS90_HYPVG|nr:uncharacterized protein TRIVIDRAFT_91410 [Trichoderma virens Gv29-8]EHK23198.1 hypothetical protein TRIVIDRAFT_91410 [Trichoderma virens Gv29-8]UKZ48002.1 hypothetical protein TrVGV298_002238 [Trichoderma virens]